MRPHPGCLRSVTPGTNAAWPACWRSSIITFTSRTPSDTADPMTVHDAGRIGVAEALHIAGRLLVDRVVVAHQHPGRHLEGRDVMGLVA
jgi:hypothetical protein